LAGPSGSSEEVLAYYQRLLPHFAGLSLSLSQLRLEPRGAWRLQLSSGAWVMLGRRQHGERLARLSASWQRELANVSDHIRYIDLRYPNGVAVAWHGETEFQENESTPSAE
jgi:cell division protein FtsQ